MCVNTLIFLWNRLLDSFQLHFHHGLIRCDTFCQPILPLCHSTIMFLWLHSLHIPHFIHVLFQASLLLDRELLLTCRQNACFLQICHLIYTVVVQCGVLNFLRRTSTQFIMQLSDVLQKFTHLRQRRLFPLLILSTTRTIPIMFPDI